MADVSLDLPEQPLPAVAPRFIFPEDPEDPPDARGRAPDPYQVLADLPSPTPRAPQVADALPHELYEARVSIVAALRQHGYSRSRIAHALKMGLAGVDWCIRQARVRGELQKGMIEAAITLEEEAVPLAVEGVLAALKKRNPEVAMKVLEGKGLLQHYSANKEGGGNPAAPMAFQFNFITKDGTPLPEQPALPALPGDVVGTARVE